ncbi:MAG: LSM domain-containing protein [Thermoplasmata archaeon]
MATNVPGLLGRIGGKRVELRLKDGRTVVGRFLGSDEHLNFVLEEAEERAPTGTRRLGRLIVRGSSVASLHSDFGGRS